jgi:hypothetical protein
MQNKKVLNIIGKTMPFVWLKLGINFATAIIVIIWIVICLGMASLFGNVGVLAFLFGLGGCIAIIKLVSHYILYLVKAAHITAINTYIFTGNLPAEGQVRTGIEKVKNNIGTATIVAGVDYLVKGAVRQILRWLTKLENVLSLIPGLSVLASIFNKIVETACNYIDECILGYIFLKKDENPEINVWKTSAEGIVLYGQNWKKVAKSAVKSVFLVYALKIILFIILLAIGSLIGATSLSGGFLIAALVVAVITWAISKSLIDPIATVTMIVGYYEAIEENSEPQIDMYDKMKHASRKFRTIIDKGEDAIRTSGVIA